MSIRFGREICVVGDLIIDEFIRAHALGISAETPTVVAREIDKLVTIGGAGLVARHINHLGGLSYITTLYQSFPLNYVTLCPNLCVLPLYREGWRVSKKTRYFVDGYKLLQLDEPNDMRYAKPTDGKHGIDQRDFVDHTMKIVKSHLIDTVVISDNRHGVIDPLVAWELIDRCKKMEVRTIVDSQLSQDSSDRCSWYHGCSIMMLNKKEASAIIKHEFNGEEDLYEISGLFACDVIVKLGEAGSHSVIGKRIYRNYAPTIDVVDTCGAGDAFLAVIALSDMNNPDHDLAQANEWAANSCTMVGTTIEGEK